MRHINDQQAKQGASSTSMPPHHAPHHARQASPGLSGHPGGIRHCQDQRPTHQGQPTALRSVHQRNGAQAVLLPSFFILPGTKFQLDPT